MSNDSIENISNDLKERVNIKIYEVVKRILNESTLEIQKKREEKDKQQAHKVLEATLKHTLRPQSGDRKRVIVSALRELIHQCGYERNGELLVNIRDILGIIEELESNEPPKTYKNPLDQRPVPKDSPQ